MTFAKEAWVFVLPFLVLAGGLWLLDYPRWAAGLFVAGLLVLLFFRNPTRAYHGEEPAILAAADGRVLSVDLVEAPAIGPGRYHRIATFLSVFDVHVQRCPASGEVLSSRYTPGAKLAAFHPQAGELNESHLTVLQRSNGDVLGVRQVAGLVARRVVCYVGEGDQLERGQLLGLIKFGSRVDLLVPEGYKILVSTGDRVRTGQTAVAMEAHD